MITIPLRNMLILSALVAGLLPSSVASARAPAIVQAQSKPASSSALASYIFVCRDAHGNLDRRACHHMGRSDPQRVTVAMR